MHTLVQDYWLPTIRAAIEMNRSNPARAIELLQVTAPLELNNRGGLYPGQAYLRLQRGNEAAAEFQKLLDHRGACEDSGRMTGHSDVTRLGKSCRLIALWLESK